MYNERVGTYIELEQLPDLVLAALEAIRGGATADSVESEVLEFKSDPVHRGRSGNPRAEILEKLISESVCLANGEARGGYILVGVEDKTPGIEAFTGTELDPDEVTHKIFGGTRPQLRVETSVVEFCGVQLLLIRIPEALTLYTRTKGEAWKRVGTGCEPISEDERRAIVAQRANPDFSNRTSDKTADDVALFVLDEARRLLREKQERAGLDPAVPETKTGLLRELGLCDQAGRLNNAGRILLLPAAPGDVTIRHLARKLPGAQPKVREFTGPVLADLPAVRRLIAENASSEIERVQFDDGQEVAIPRFPLNAVDEVLTNAIVHRDWQVSRPVVIDQSPKVLKVWSPGPLPIGVSADRLLSTQSVPRNGRLISAMRMLGLAEESSRGFDRMWMSMLSTGRSVPEVEATDTYVQIILAASHPDVDFISALHELKEEFSQDVIGSVNVLILLWHLWHSPLITMKKAMESTQTPRIEVKELMEALVELGVLQRVRDADEWVLSDTSRKLMGKTVSGDLASVTVEEWIEARLKEGAALSAAEIAESLGVERKEVTEYLRHLRKLGRAKIDPSGPQRGINARWIQP